METSPKTCTGLDAFSPRAEYTRRLEARQGRELHLARRYRLLARARNGVFGLIIALAWLGEKETFQTKVILLSPPAVVLMGLVYWRNRVSRAWLGAARAVRFYEGRLACLEGRWAGTGEPGTRFLDPAHPCALDLDLFGTGCLFELLNTARTRAGEETLAAWLLSPATPEEVRARQEAIAELRPQLDRREELALLGPEGPAVDNLAGLETWATDPASIGGSARLVAWALTALTVAALAGGWFLGIGLAPFFLALLLQGGWACWLHRGLRQITGPLGESANDLQLLAAILNRLERAPFSALRLRQLGATLQREGRRASEAIARLGRLVDRLQLAPLIFFLLGTTRTGLAIAAWRELWGHDLMRWRTAVGEFEALAALAGYAFDNPADPFAELVPEGPCFEAEGLGHPLLPAERCVRNDLRLSGDLRLLVVSGSNMAGKSTLLRSVGINAVLAQAGAPVRAERLRLAPCVVGATLRVQDSLQAGRSRFYAEILRVRQLLHLAAGRPPLLFLLDELFQGTNSHDRRIGAEAVVRSLIDAGALGLVTTHDLALTEIVELLAPRAANVHFQDQFDNGMMTFDYRLRLGVVPKSNALALMRAVGICV
jgi:hypothetical protein